MVVISQAWSGDQAVESVQSCLVRRLQLEGKRDYDEEDEEDDNNHQAEDGD